MSNTTFQFFDDIGVGTIADGTQFLFDAEELNKIKDVKWYRSSLDPGRISYIVDHNGVPVHRYIYPGIGNGMEIDHINRITYDNRKENLRICTHQQNQCNQDLQRNNTSGVTGVRYYAARHKYVARIKVGQHDIHLGYYENFEQAVQARNVGMELMFGEYARYNDVPPAPGWIRDKVYKMCSRFSDLSVAGTFSCQGM